MRCFAPSQAISRCIVAESLWELFTLLERTPDGEMDLCLAFTVAGRPAQDFLHGGKLPVGEMIVLQIGKTVIGLAEVGLQLQTAAVGRLRRGTPAEGLQHVTPRKFPANLRRIDVERPVI